MRDKLDNILLSTLWVVVAILGTCFWFNIRFGFNLFSGAHWRHLAYMQATQAPVQTSFYLSLILAVLITIGGLYVLYKPRPNTIKTDSKPSSVLQTPSQPAQIKQTSPEQTTQQIQNTTPEPAVTPEIDTELPSHTTTMPPAPTIPETMLSRPARLNLPTNTTWKLPSEQATPQTTTQQNWPELRDIFESADYTTKETPKIGNVKIALLAIGANETLWVGAVGISTEAMQNAVTTIHDIFLDTLEDIEIDIHAFVVSATDASAPKVPGILTFDTPDALRQYMNEHKNPQLDEDERENFEAFSAYISTVVDYLGKN